jgi:DNA-binding NtrC family response regulator
MSPCADKPLVLAADNDEALLDGLRETLEREGFAVVTQSQARQVLDDVRRLRPNCLVLDLFFPDGWGLDLLRELRAEDARLPVVVLTGEGYTVGNALEAVRQGAVQFLDKPLRPRTIVQCVRMAVEASQLRRRNEDLWLQSLAAQGIVGASPAMRQMMGDLRKVADLKDPLLMLGETGTGKSVVAEAIHNLGSRCRGPFFTIELSRIPPTLFHSELFGHLRGAFSDARSDKIGLVEMAKGGTLFLDEVQDLELECQRSLRAFIEQGICTPLGAIEPRRADTRLIMASNRDLTALVREGRFLADLLARISIFPFHLPGLNDRREDIPLLAERALRAEGREHGKPFQGFTPEALFYLVELDYHDCNIRRLNTLVKRAVIFTDFDANAPFLPLASVRDAQAMDTGAIPGRLQGTFRDLMAAYKRQILLRALEENDGSKTRAAQALGLSLDNFCKKLKGCDESE